MYVGSNEVIGAALGSQVGGKLILNGAIIWGKQYSISTSLTNVTIDNNATSIYYKEKYEATLSCESGKQILPSYVKIIMGGTDITSTAYNKASKSITIAEVTGNVTISAEAATISADYVPVEYIEVTTKSSSNSINTGYYPNSKTKLVLDVSPVEDNPALLYGTRNPNNTTSASNPAFHAYIKINSSSGNMQFGTVSHGSSSNLRLKTGSRVLFTCNRGVFTFIKYGGTETTVDYSDTATWTSGTTLRFFGSSATSLNYWGQGKIYRGRISEIENDIETMKRDYVPVKRLSDGHAGLYDIINGTYIEKTAYTYPS